MRKILKWAAIAFAGWAVFCVAAVLLIYIFAVPDEVKEQQSIEYEREAAVRAEEKALEEARKAEAKKIEDARKTEEKALEEARKAEEKVAEEAEKAKEAKEEVAKIQEAKAQAVDEGFDSIKDWANLMCGDSDFVEDSFKEHWDKKPSSWFAKDGYSSGKLDDLRGGWIRDAEKGGVVDTSDFPAKYRFVAKSKGNYNGDRHWVQHERFYNYDCSFYGNSISDVDFTKVSMP